ncbi:RING-H2 finger protein ATL57 [Prosopis cineraria]|uniref:RING-H2 finger protein ATL57 n=1 Tax=Prosopis cineraria TaxID=364024 RepID=UPI00240F7D81|nr:RING-H2 finger protein ATL57 [Prosopis cineraria]
MELYNRRLLLLNEDEPSSNDASSPPRLTAAPLSASLFVTPLKLSAPVTFNSEVACIVIIVLLLIAFIVLFMRRFADHSPAPARYLPSASSNYYSPSSSCGGLDQTTVQSLPGFRYNAEAKNQEDCAICLSEFEIGETVKMVPNCKHVFHQQCIDRWLSSHVTCPICRGTKFFVGEQQQAESAKAQPTSDQVVGRRHVASTVENGETWRQGSAMGTCSRRRSRSCSSFRDTVVLRRTLSY